MQSDSLEQYHLIFEGPADSSDDTLRRIKGVFLADLEMPVEQILSILQSAPARVQESADPETLRAACELLRNAGSKVMIVSANGRPWTPSTEPDSDDMFSIDLEESMEQALLSPVGQPETTTTWELKEEALSDIEHLLQEAADGIDDSVANEPPSEEVDRHTFSLQIDTASEAGSMKPAAPSAAAPPAVEVSTAPSAEPLSAAPQEQFDLTLMLDDAPAPATAEKPEPAPLTPAAPTTPDFPELSLSLDDDTPSIPESRAAAAPPSPVSPQEPFNLSLSLDDEEPTPVPERQGTEPAPAPEPEHQPAPQPSPLLSLDATLESAPPSEPKKAAQPALATEEEPNLPPEPAQKKQKPISPLVRQPAQPQAAADPAQNPAPDINLVTVRDLRRKKLPPHYEMAVFVGIGSILLFIANWFYFNQPPPAQDREVESAQELALKVAQKKKLMMKKQLAAEEEARKLAESQKPQEYQGSISVDAYRFDLGLHLAGNSIHRMTLSVVSPPQPEPTNEQIARGEILPPWIRRVETGAFELSSEENGQFSAKAVAKIFVEYQGVPNRLVRQVLLKGGPAAEGAPREVTIRLAESDTPHSTDDLWSLRGGPAGIEFTLQRKVMMQPVAPQAPAAPASNPQTK